MNLKLSVLSLSAAAVLMTACEPRDTKITRPDNRATSNGGPGGSTQANGKADNYKYIGLLADRQVEAIEIFRALTDADFAAARNFVIEDVTVKDQVFKKITSKVENLATPQSVATRELKLLAKITSDANGKAQKIEIKELKEIDAKTNKEKGSFEKAEKGSLNVSLNNKQKRILIERVADLNSWNVSIEQLDQINLTVGKSTMMNNLEFTFSVVDGNQDIFAIKAVRMNHMRSGTQVGDFSFESDGTATLTIEMHTADKCAVVSGSLHLNSVDKNSSGDKPLYERTLSYEKGILSIKAASGKMDGAPLVFPDCEGRLSVDLGKLL